MKLFQKIFYTCIIGLGVLCSNLAYAQDVPKKPSATVRIDETQFALIFGGSAGKGVLTYQGKEYPFKIGGLSLGVNIGISKVSATGEVYDLNDISQFPGIFTKVESGITLGGGVGGTILKNENGVIMRLSSTSEGIQLNLSTSGVRVKFED